METEPYYTAPTIDEDLQGIAKRVECLEAGINVRLNELHIAVLELSDRVDTLEELTRELRGRHGRPID